MQTLIALLVFVLVAGLIWYLVTLLPLPEPFAKIAQIIVILILVLFLLGWMFGSVSLPALRL